MIWSPLNNRTASNLKSFLNHSANNLTILLLSDAPSIIGNRALGNAKAHNWLQAAIPGLKVPLYSSWQESFQGSHELWTSNIFNHQNQLFLYSDQWIFANSYWWISFPSRSQILVGTTLCEYRVEYMRFPVMPINSSIIDEKESRKYRRP